MTTHTSTTKLEKNNPENWTEKEINNWFEKQDWLFGWEVKPGASINKRSLCLQFHKNPKRWEKAFTFLKETDLQALPTGKTELDGKHLFVGVDEYQSKNLTDTKYESHKKYIDIQYVVSGEEKLGLVSLSKVSGNLPYNEEKDLMFYNFEGGTYLNGNPDCFFIFFPEDVHRPCVKSNESVRVKKLVVKVEME